MSEPAPDNANISPLDDLLSTLKRRVNERREAGEYPPELEEHLSRHFERIVEHRALRRDRDLHQLVDDWERTVHYDPAQVPINSRVPFVPTVHKMARHLGERQAQTVVKQMTERIRALADLFASELDDLDARVRAEAITHIDVLYEQLAELHTAANSGDERLAALEERMAELESRLAESSSHTV
jgi:hypothetical protein